MMVIKFMASFGQEKKEVEISQPNGAAGAYQLLVGHYYYGGFYYFNNQWMFQGNDPAEAELTTTDREILIEMVIEDQARKGIERDWL